MRGPWVNRVGSMLEPSAEAGRESSRGGGWEFHDSIASSYALVGALSLTTPPCRDPREQEEAPEMFSPGPRWFDV
jgi:hypothetical protein